MFNHSSISILGCGWLGLPLAKSLKSHGVTVRGSTTSADKLPLLAEARIEPYLVQFAEGESPACLPDFLDSDALIITVPPGRTAQKQKDYGAMLDSLTEAIPQSSIRKVIFISSSAVYGDLNKTFLERDDPQPSSDSGLMMLKAEKVIASIPIIETVILRSAGLVGPQRHPGRFLAGKKSLPNGQSPVNLVHQRDVIGIIEQILQTDKTTGVYNVCVPHHPSRQDFYRLAAEKLGLEPPEFVVESKEWKIISSDRVEQELGYRYQTADLLQWLSST